MLVLAFPPRAPSASETSITEWRVSRRVIRRILRALSRIPVWTRGWSRPRHDSRIHAHDVAVLDRREVVLTAHDCLTLLAVMVRCADAMRHPGAEDDFLEFRRAVDRMDQVAQQWISPQRRETATPEPIELNRLVAESEGMLKRAVAPGISLRLQLAASPESRVRARRWDLERIVLNLVLNTARTMAAGGIVAVETASMQDGGPSVRLIVSDSGAVSPRSARVIPRFSASTEHGSGLGLAAVAQLVQRLNGVLQFESDSERRTRIQVDFPLAPGDAPRNAA
jgi:two-component system, cell cycle sensor histidine kinase and response regulator CckA